MLDYPRKRRVIDLFCGAGGCSKGYERGGWEVVLGIDSIPQPNYPYTFVQMDALDFLRVLLTTQNTDWFDVIHASPPCQKYSVTKSLTTKDHPDLLEPTRKLLVELGKDYIIENVPGAELIEPLLLCGTMFGLGVQRHRLFENTFGLTFSPMSCNHDGLATGNRARRKFGITRTPSLKDGFKFVTVAGNNYLKSEGEEAMGIFWMTKKELSQAIPPAYTEYIAKTADNLSRAV